MMDVSQRRVDNSGQQQKLGLKGKGKRGSWQPRLAHEKLLERWIKEGVRVDVMGMTGDYYLEENALVVWADKYALGLRTQGGCEMLLFKHGVSAVSPHHKENGPTQESV